MQCSDSPSTTYRRRNASTTSRTDDVRTGSITAVESANSAPLSTRTGDCLRFDMTGSRQMRQARRCSSDEQREGRQAPSLSTDALMRPNDYLLGGREPGEI